MEEKNKLYVGNLEYNVTEEELRKAFDDKGIQTKELRIVKDKYTGRSKGFGFVEVTSEEDVQKAIDSLNGEDLRGRKLRVNKARRPRPRMGRRSFERRI